MAKWAKRPCQACEGHGEVSGTVGPCLVQKWANLNLVRLSLCITLGIPLMPRCKWESSNHD